MRNGTWDHDELDWDYWNSQQWIYQVSPIIKSIDGTQSKSPNYQSSHSTAFIHHKNVVAS